MIAMRTLAADAPPASQPTRVGWRLTWRDEFDGPKIDTSRWEIIRRRDSHNEEKQFYVPEQASIMPAESFA
jgi:hypothetical protein